MNKKYNRKSFYECKYCERIFDFESIVKHKCILDYEDVKSCATCKHLEIELYPQYPRHMQLINDVDVLREFGRYNKFFCKKRLRTIDDMQFTAYSDNEDCYESSGDTLLDEEQIVHSKEFMNYLEQVEAGLKGQQEITKWSDELRDRAKELELEGYSGEEIYQILLEETEKELE